MSILLTGDNGTGKKYACVFMCITFASHENSFCTCEYVRDSGKLILKANVCHVKVHSQTLRKPRGRFGNGRQEPYF